MKLFPNIDLVNIHWQRQCSETTRAFDVSEQLLQFENLKTFWLEIHKDEQRGDIPGQGPDVLEEDFGWELKEMEMIFEHLPLSHLKELEIYIGSPIDHARIELQSIAMQNALASMRFPELEYFGYRGQIELLGDLPQRSLWVSALAFSVEIVSLSDNLIISNTTARNRKSHRRIPSGEAILHQNSRSRFHYRLLHALSR